MLGASPTSNQLVGYGSNQSVEHLDDFDEAVVIAMVTVGVVEVAVDKVVDVVAMGEGWVTTVFTVVVGRVVGSAMVIWSALFRCALIDT